jgi:hypothetical protein
MDINFQFNHSLLSIIELREKGIRTTKQLEESFDDPYSKLKEIKGQGDGPSVFENYGFSDSMLPIKIIFSIEGDTIVTKWASVFSREDVRRHYCG